LPARFPVVQVPSMANQKRRLWVISEPYWPEQISTGYFLTGIAECLTAVRDVGVVCSMRAAEEVQRGLARRDVRNGVQIYRTGLRFGYPQNLAVRSLVELWMAAAMSWRAFRLVRRGDEMLAVTTPPLSPFLMSLVAKLRGVDFDLLIHDVYPDVLAVAGVVREGGFAYRMLQRHTLRLYRRCRRIIVLSEDMRETVRGKLGDGEVPVHVIPNWGDVDSIRPKRRDEVELLRELQLADRFVVQYSGNIGRTHGVELLVEVADRMRRTDEDVFFLIIGAGSMKESLRQQVEARGLANVRLLDRQPDDKFADTITACDLALVTLQQGMSGLSTPSRLYNLLAAGSPLLVIADAESKPARVVAEQALGWVVPPGDVDAACAAIREARTRGDELAAMSARARDLAEKRYSYPVVCGRLRELYRAEA